MLKLNAHKSAPALLMALTVSSSAIAPLALATPSQAQTYGGYSNGRNVSQIFSPASRQVSIPVGQRLPVSYTNAEKVVLLPNETVPLTLTLSRNIRASNNALLIPAGSQIKGNMKPMDGGTQFIADELIMTDGTRMRLDASSRVLATNETIRRGTNTGSVLKGAAIGSAAAAAISGVTGNKKITLGKVLIGTAAGTLGGFLFGKKQVDVVSINPNTDLDLTLNSSLTVAMR